MRRATRSHAVMISLLLAAMADGSMHMRDEGFLCFEYRRSRHASRLLRFVRKYDVRDTACREMPRWTKR
jgi:hypothetical protein